MTTTASVIPLTNLAIAFLPAFIALLVCWRWSRNVGRASYALARMLTQLLLVGYVLAFIFGTDNPWLVVGVLATMILVSSWIAVGSLKSKGLRSFRNALVSVSAGGITTLALVTIGVLELDPWYEPRFMIPLAGMIFANSMTTISLAGERLEAELAHEDDFPRARSIAFNAALIPNINSMFAVGLVSLPGMMTGQILSGVSPLIAVRYQIVVMSMIFGAAAVAAACYLSLAQPKRN